MAERDLTDLEMSVVRDFADAFEIPQRTAVESEENFFNRCRAWCLKLAQTMKAQLPSSGEWGVKSASPTRPQSKDSIALRTPEDQLSWDIFLGTGTGKPKLADEPECHDISDQHFMAVVAKDWLGGSTPEPPEPPTPNPCPPCPPCPPCTCDGPATYETSLKVDLVILQITDRYRAVHGREPAWADIGHNLWRWYREDRWPSLAAILADIK